MRKIRLTPKLIRTFKENKISIRKGLFTNVRCSSAPVHIEPFCNFHKTKNICSMGAFSYSHSRLPLDMVIGRYCSIARGLKTFGDEHPTDRFTTSPITYNADFLVNRPNLKFKNIAKSKHIEIKNDVWIGQDVTLKPGITINNGAIIAANSVVTKDVPSYSIVGGVPAKVIRYRFTEDEIKTLNALKWWDYSCFDFTDIDMDCNIADFITQFNEKILSSDIAKYTPEKLVL